MNATTELVPFVGGDLEAVRDIDGAVWVVARRVCEAIGLSADAQRRRLQAQPWARTTMTVVRDSAGREQEAFMVHLDTLPMWLATVDAGRVDADVAARLVRFQLEARDALARHFARGSGGALVSGGAVGSGGTLQMLAAVEGLLASVRVAVADVAAVQASQQALARQVEGLAGAVDAAVRRGVEARESRRACKAATDHLSARIREWCRKTGVHWRVPYGSIRIELGMRRSRDGGPAFGAAGLRADQILRAARLLHRMGVAGCDVATVQQILNGDDENDDRIVDVASTAVERTTR
jgi:hypothetical protein